MGADRAVRMGCGNRLLVLLAQLSVNLLQYYPIICVLVATSNYLTHGAAVALWPCWFPLEFGLGYGPGLGMFTPIWCWDTGKYIGWGWAIFELGFFCWFQYQFRRLSALTVPPPISDEQRDLIFGRCLNATADPRELLAGWFQGCTFEQLKRGNVVEWLSWALYSSRKEHLLAHEVDCLEAYMDQIELKWQLSIPMGYNPELANKVCRISLDPLPAQHRPLLLYTAVAAARLCMQQQLRLQGFKKRECGGIQYWQRDPDRQQGSSWHRPIVLLHGLGIGACSYAPVAAEMVRRYGQSSALILPEFDFIATSLVLRVPSSDQIVAALEQMVRLACGADRKAEATFVGSSFGTIFLSWMLQRKPDLVAAAVLSDPVVFLLHHPSVCRHAAYPDINGPGAVLQRYFLIGEIGIALTIHRHFWWFENTLWLEQLPQRLLENKAVVVMLGSLDFLVPSAAVRRYLEPSDVQLLYVEGGDHVQWIQSGWARARAIELFEAVHLADQREVHVMSQAQAEPFGLEDEVDVVTSEEDHLIFNLPRHAHIS